MNNLVRKKLVEDPASVAIELEQHRQEFLKALAAFPVPVESVIYEARTPFTTYCRIRSLCETTQDKLFYCDRFMDHTIFHRLLEGVPSHVIVTLVTIPQAMKNPFLDVSRLYAKERPKTYRLLTEPTFHDRLMQCDGQIYHLGGSVKDAADKSIYTISRVESTAANLQRVTDLIGNGTELFGQTVSIHP